MGQGARGKNIIYALVLAIGMSLLFPEGAFSASRSFRRLGKFRSPAVHSRHRFVGPFRSDFGFVLGRRQGLHRFKDPFDPPVLGPGSVVGWGSLEGTSSTWGTSSSSSYRHQLPTHPENLHKPERTCTHSGWTAVKAWRS